MYRRLVKKRNFSKFLSLCIFLNFRYLTKYFAQTYREQYGAAMGGREIRQISGTAVARGKNWGAKAQGVRED